ncbi:MAG: hypothetical protein FVQ04_02390 [Nitrospira sp.]|nr:hypothetical protein [Nitrospira sp.]
MVTGFIFGLNSLILLVLGLAMLIVPSEWGAWIRRTMKEPLSRFLLAQAMVLCGLLLLLGGLTDPGYWLWVAIGALMIVKGMAWLGLSASLRDRLLSWHERYPIWTHRLGGVVMMALATLLGIDAVRRGL